MNILKEIEKIQESSTKIRNISINLRGKSITLSIEFFRSGESLYARNNLLSLSAGSQDKDSDMAELKALMRLVNKVFLKIMSHKRNNSLGTLFSESTPDYGQKLKEFDLFSAELSEKSNSTMFNVIEENIEKLSEKVYQYTLKKITEVSDPAHVQHAKKETLNSKDKIEIENITITKSQNDWVSLAIA